MPNAKKPNRYSAIIEKLFAERYRAGAKEIPFSKSDIKAAGGALGIELPENIADIVYSHRYRTAMPERIIRTQPKGLEWSIVGKGKSRYAFKLTPFSRITPNANLIAIKLPDATPEIIASYALTDEQALLAKVRYNRLIDIFLGFAAYSLQNHLRTSVASIGQVEIDELYVGVDRGGRQFIVPVQAKRGSDRLGSVQISQDIAFCEQKFPDLVCRPVAAQFVDDDRIAMFELAVEAGSLKVADERHYKLVPADRITSSDLAGYRSKRS